MALPRLNEVPKYDVTIPSTGQGVTYRPFLVKEQKVLLMAMETNDQKQIIRAIVDTIGACILDKIDVKRLTTFDLEYLFTRIRSKSAGETSTVFLQCGKCEHKNEIKINLDEIQVNFEARDKKIKLTDQYTLLMKYPQYDALLMNINESDKVSLTKSIFDLIMVCMDKLQTDEDQIEFQNETKQEIEKFLGGLTAGQLELIMEWVRDLPKLTHDIKFKCENCDKDNEITLQGIQDFF